METWWHGPLAACRAPARRRDVFSKAGTVESTRPPPTSSQLATGIAVVRGKAYRQYLGGAFASPLLPVCWLAEVQVRMHTSGSNLRNESDSVPCAIATFDFAPVSSRATAGARRWVLSAYLWVRPPHSYIIRNTHHTRSSQVCRSCVAPRSTLIGSSSIPSQSRTLGRLRCLHALVGALNLVRARLRQSHGNTCLRCAKPAIIIDYHVYATSRK